VPGSPSDRWRRVDELFHLALSRPAADRDAFLEAECIGDPGLLAEVRSLVSADASGEAGYEDWVPQVAAAWMSERSPSLAGRLVGRYRVLDRLGAGSMGEVYRAEDTALRRAIALKILPMRFVSDPDRIRRFEQEARAASALNHPNIVTIHEIGVADDVHFIASELVEGRALRDRLREGPLPLDEALGIAVQVAAGLAAAHAARAIHRDIKPENLVIRPDGLVKIVDFGLAKLIEDPAEGRLPASSTRVTRAGSTPGTVSYMSPEQALGEPLDARTDLFSLAVVLYEMLTGVLPFERATEGATYDAILNRAAVPPSAANPMVTPELDTVLLRGLAKERSERYQTAVEFGAELQRLRSEAVDLRAMRAAGPAMPATADAADAASGHSGGRWRRHAAIGVLSAVALAGVVWTSRSRGAASVAVDPSPLAFVQVSHQDGEEAFPALSPDLNLVAYASPATGNWDIYLHRIGGDPINLTADSPADDIQPAFSPDGQRILFRSDRDGGGLFVMAATGGAVTRIADSLWEPAWSPDGREIVGSMAWVDPTTLRFPESPLWVVNLASGEKRRLVDGPAYQPHWSPSGGRIAYSGPDAEGQRNIWTAPAGGGAPVRLTADRHSDWNPVWSADGRFLYFLSDRDGTMNAWRMRVDEATGRPLEDPQPFTLPATRLMTLARAPLTDAFAWSSQFGGHVIQRLDMDVNSETVVGGPVALTPRSRSLAQPDLSPDGRWLVANTRGEAREDLVVVRTDGSEVLALTADEFRDRGARWSPDGQRLAFWSDRDGRAALYVVDRNGGQLERIATSPGRGPCCPVWAPNGRRLVYLADDLTLRAIDFPEPAGSAGRDVLFARLPVGVWFEPVAWSADGTRLAGQERRGNNPRAGIAVFDIRTGRYQQLTGSGGKPNWMADDRRIIYSDGSSAFVLDSMSTRIRPLFSVKPYQNNDVTMLGATGELYVSVRAVEADVWVTRPK
jgi:Tol biopolymer transport system component